METDPQTERSRGCLSRIVRIAGVLLAVAVLVLLGLFINQRLALRRFWDRHPPPGETLQVNGHAMHLHCIGTGSPTVVIDAGSGSFSVEWLASQENLAATTRVCVYDRAGYGWSDPGPAPRDGVRVANELHTLLQAAGDPGPYVLVGHSLGGVHAQVFAGRYPDQTAGLVLVDAPSEYVMSPEFRDMTQGTLGTYRTIRFLAGSGILRALAPLGGDDTMPEQAQKMDADAREIYLQAILDPQHYSTGIAEIEHLDVTLQQAGNAMAGEQPLGDRPLIVLTAGRRAVPGDTPFDVVEEPVDEAEIARQSAMAALSSRGEQRTIADSGHLIHLDAPEAVLRAVTDVVEMVRE